MCGRFAADITPERLRKLFGLGETPRVQPRYNIAPGQLAAVVRSEGDHNRIDLLKWGLVPEGSSDASQGSRLINAGYESLDKPAFRHAIRYRRCIVPASGYYEWEITRDHRKQPWLIQSAHRRPLALAGLWEAWKAPDGTLLQTFTILTTTANSLVSKFHDRMPVLLQPDDFPLWLSRNMHDPHQLRSLFEPSSPSALGASRVSDLVNDPHCDEPACCIPF